MKKKVLSLLFACIMLLSVLAIAGCKSDELQAQIDENATKAETAVTDAAAKAAKDLADAKAELEALIAAGDQADVKALNDAVAKLNTAIEAAKTAATAADDALKTELTAAIAAAKKEATDAAAKALDEAVKKLNADVALKVDATAYEKAVADLQTSVANAKTAATEADAEVTKALEAKIAAAQTAAIEDAKKYVDGKVEDLKDLQTADKTELAAAIQEVKDAAAAADAAAKKAFADATAADTALEGKLNDKLAALEEAIKGANTSANNAWGEWNEATEIVIKNLAELKKAEKTFEGSKYYALLSDTIKNKAIEIIAETEARLLRSVDKAAAEAEYKYAGNFFAAIDGIYKAYESYSVEKKAYYYAEQLEEMKVALEKAMKAIEDATNKTDIPAIQTALEADLDKVHNKAEAMMAALTADGDPVKAVILNEKWAKLLADVDYKLKNEDEKIAEELKFLEVSVKYGEYKVRYDDLNKLKGLFDGAASDAKQLTTYFKDEKNLFTAAVSDKCQKLFANVDGWIAQLGETNEENMKMVDTVAFADLKAIYEVRKQNHIDYVTNDLWVKLSKYTADGYVYNYSEAEEKAVFDLYTEYGLFDKYVAYVEFEMHEKLVAAYDAFVKGAYARATEIHEAKLAADAINKRIGDLTVILKNLTTFKTEYQDEMTAINKAVADWDAKYFAESFAGEKVVGNANYDLLNHTAYEALKTLYAEKLGAIELAMKAVTDAFNAEGFKTINLLSKDEIDAAKTAWNNLIKLVGDLGLDTKEITVGHIDELGEGDATTVQINDLLDKKTIAFKAACEAAYKEYKALNHAVLAADKVSIYDDKAVGAMAIWYNTFLGIDPMNAESVLPKDGEGLVLSEADNVIMSTELYTAAKETCTALTVLLKSKVTEELNLEADIAAFVKGTINTESKAAYDDLVARVAAFLNGDGAVELGYNKAQYAVTSSSKTLYYIDTAELEKAGAKIADLIAKRNALLKRIADLAEMTDVLLDVTKEKDNITLIDTLEADMAAFVVENAGFNSFADVEVVLEQSREIIEIAVTYDVALKSVGGIKTEAVKKDLIDRATAARTEALKLIRTLAPEAWATSDAYAVEKAKLEIVKSTIDSYLKYADVKEEALMAERYENTVKGHMAKATVEALAALELAGKDVDTMIADITYAIDDAFKNIGASLV